jgi:uncharacterized repeat protein (TIGR01451 family)
MLDSHFFQLPSRDGKGRGQALVEFALTLLVFLMLLVMIIEVGRILWTYVTLQHAAKTGARYAVTGRWLTEYAEDTVAHYNPASDDPLAHIDPCHPLFPDDPAGDDGSFPPAGAWEFYEPYRNPRTCSVERLTLEQMALLPLDVNADSGDPGFYEVVVSGYTTDTYPTTGTFTRACATCPGGQEELFYSDYFDPVALAGDNPGLSRGFAGTPQQKVVVQIRYRLPIITPILSAIAPSVRLDGTATMVNEAWGSTGNNREAILPPPFVDDLEALEDVQPANLVVTGVTIDNPPSPHEIGVGEQADFTVVIKNIGNQDAVDAFDVALYAHRNAGMTETPLTDGGFIALSTPQSVGSLNRDTEDTLTFTGVDVTPLIAAGGGPFYIYAWVDSGNTVDEVGTGETTFPDNEKDNANAASDPLVVETAYQLAVTTTFSETFPASGQQVTYNVEISNTGSAASPALWLNNFLPAGLTFVSDDGPDGTYNAGNDRWEVGPVASGGTASIQLTVQVTGSTGDTITAWDEEMVDAGLGNPITYTATTDTMYVGGAEVGVSVDEVTFLPATNQIQVGLSVTNSSLDNDATGVQVIHSYEAAAVTGWTATGGTYAGDVWDVGTLPADSTAAITLVGDLAYGGFTFTSTATLSVSGPSDGDTDTGSATVPGIGLTVTLSPITDPVVVGEAFEFMATIANAGPNPATGVEVEIAFPPTGVTPNTTVTRSDISVGVGAGGEWTENFTVTLDAAPPDPLTFTATITAHDQLLTNGWGADNLTDTMDVSPTLPTVELTVNKSVDSGNPSPEQAFPGDTVTYTITVQNDDADPSMTLEGLQLADNLPADLTNITVESVTAGSYSAGTWTVGDLAPGGTATLTLNADVDSSVPGGTVITNTITDSDVDATNAIVQVSPGSTPSASLTVGSIEFSISLGTDGNVFAVDEDTVEFTISVQNTGTADVSDLHVSLTGGGDFGLPDELSFVGVVSNTHGTVGSDEWVIDTLPAGETARLVFTATVDSVPDDDFSGGITAEAQAQASGMTEQDDTNFKVYEPLWVNLGTTNSSCPALSWGGSTAAELSGLPGRLSGNAPSWLQNQSYSAAAGWGYTGGGGSRYSGYQEFHYPDDSDPVDSTTQDFFECRTEGAFTFRVDEFMAGEYRVYLAVADYAHGPGFFNPGRVFDVHYQVESGSWNSLLNEYNIAAEAGGRYRVHVETVTFTLGAAADSITLYFNNGESGSFFTDRTPLVQGVGLELIN